MAVKTFWERITRLFRTPTPVQTQPRGPTTTYTPQRTPVVSPQPVLAPTPTAPPEGPLDQGSVVQMIHKAGRELLVLQITYDGMSRMVEPYSFREKSTGRLFYGYCSIHGRIHSFKPSRITHCEITNIHFSPKWEVEL